jgi:hypothetical protein
MEDLARVLGLDRGRAAIERLELGEGRPDQRHVGERRAVADWSLLGDDCDQRVHRVVRCELGAPATGRRRAVKADGDDLADRQVHTCTSDGCDTPRLPLR